MPYAPASRSAGALLALGVAIFVAGFVYNQVSDRDQLRARAAAITGGDPARGEAMFIQYGCGACHQATHVRKAVGKVGLSLDGIAVRAMIAGKLANSPDNLERWIRDPQAITPGTDMPDLNVGDEDVRDITAFLYTRTG